VEIFGCAIFSAFSSALRTATNMTTQQVQTTSAGNKLTKQCTYCGSEITSQAVLCPTCKSYQSTLRNILVFAGGLTGFITLFATALVFTANQALDIRKQIFWRDHLEVLELIAIPPRIQTILSSHGDGSVFASKVIFRWRDSSFSFPLDKPVAVNGIELVDNKSQDMPSAHSGFVGNKTGLATPPIIENAATGQIDGKPACLTVAIFDANNTDLERMKGHYLEAKQKLVTDPAEATVFFFGARGTKILRADVSVVATFVKLTSPECQNLQLE